MFDIALSALLVLSALITAAVLLTFPPRPPRPPGDRRHLH
jgi:hypothetical protein